MATISSDKLLSFLRKHKFQELGSGLYSDVFAPAGSDRVIKVCRSCDDWPKYIFWATKMGYAGTIAPKVHSFHFIEKDHRSFYAASMERLYPLTEEARDLRKQALFRLYSGTRSPEALKIKAFIEELQTQFPMADDLHDGNWMCRQDGSLVITDPLRASSSSKDDLPKRLRTRDIAMLRNAQFANQRAYANRA